jgi:hypothetical protein
MSHRTRSRPPHRHGHSRRATPNVNYINSTGKQLLCDLASCLQESHIVLELVVPFDSPTRRLIELSGLQSLAALVLVRRQDASEVGPVELVLPAQPWAVKNIRHALRGWLSAAGASPHIIDDLLIAVGEAATNVVDHAYGTDGGILTVHLELQAPTVVATIADTGRWGQPSVGNRGRECCSCATVPMTCESIMVLLARRWLSIGSCSSRKLNDQRYRGCQR